MTASLRVAINAQLVGNGRAGGVESAVRGLVHALGRLDGGDTEYVVVTHPWAAHWLDGALGPTQRTVVHPYPARVRFRPLLERVRRRLGPARAALRPLWKTVQARADAPSRPERSRGFFESLGVDVVHFPYQAMVLTSIPSLYNPWDLQHLHHPELFDPAVFARREATYPVYCRHAHAVAVASRFTAADVVARYGVDRDRAFVIPLAAATALGAPPAAATLARVRAAHRLPERFALYPAAAWPHKNHLRLLEALARLRDRDGIVVNLVATGARNEFWPAVERRVAELGLAIQTWFLGFVDAETLRALYRLATLVVIPSLFEGWGFPLIEAFHEGVAVASSSAASLGEYAGDAALLFDPTSVDAIAAALARLASDVALRADLVERGRRRAQAFSWERAARAHRALYRKVAGMKLGPEDEALLAEAR